MKNKSKMDFTCRLMLPALLGSTSLALADMEIAPRGNGNTNEMRMTKRWTTGNRFEGEQAGERLIDRLLANAKLTAEVGLSEENVTKLREETRTIQSRQNDLDAQIRKLSLDQADRMSKLLLAADANTNEIMKTVEEIGRLRTEQAKLAVQDLLIVRKYLTPEQIRKARELMRERMTAKKDADVHAAKKEKPAGPPPPKPPEGW